MLVGILAAGLSSRFGRHNKLTAPYRGAPLIVHSVNSCVRAAVGDVFVVLGHQASDVRDTLRAVPVQFVDNDAYASGLGSSVARAAAAALRQDAHLLLHLGDVPSVRSETIRRIAVVHQGRDDWAVVPTFGGRHGHPVLFGFDWLKKLVELPADVGARHLLSSESAWVEHLDCDDPGIVLDVDEPHDLS